MGIIILRSFHIQIGARGSLLWVNFVVIFITPCRQMVFAFFHILPNLSYLISVLNSFFKRCSGVKRRGVESYIEISKYVLWYWKVWYAMTVLYVFVQTPSFPMKTWSFVSYCCMYWQKEVLPNNLLNFCISMWKSLCHTFIIHTTFCFFRSLHLDVQWPEMMISIL